MLCLPWTAEPTHFGPHGLPHGRLCRLPRHELLIDNITEQFNNIDLFEWQAP